jgi:hypothetical protein
MKFVMDNVPLRSALKSYFLFRIIDSTKMADERASEVGLSLVALTIASYNDAW